MVLALAALVVVAAALWPGAAQAHGPIAPIASDYLARVSQLPAGLRAEVIDGDQRLWLRAPAGREIVVLDYREAPYLRFSRTGVSVNRNSAMYYLNQTPAETPPPKLGPRTIPQWASVSSGHTYNWHDGRLHALASVALAPGATYVGRWSIPVRVDGRRAAVTGGVWHASRPSIVWFWPIIVVLACSLAAWRLRRPSVDAVTARLLAVAALLAIAVAALARELHGRPSIAGLQWITLAVTLGFAGWAGARVLLQRPGYFTYFVIAFIAIWEGAELFPTLVNGFVLAAVPAFVARSAGVIALGCGGALLLFVLRLADQARPRSGARDEWDAMEASEDPFEADLGRA